MSPDDLRLLIQQRIDWEASVANFHPPDILFKPCVFGGVAAEEASPEARTAVPCDTLLYLHGGGYVTFRDFPNGRRAYKRAEGVGTCSQ